MKLIHYSPKPLTEVRDARNTVPDLKPNGLWVSVEGEDDWPSWCRSEGFATDRLGCETEIILRPDAKILHLQTALDLLDFTRRHVVQSERYCADIDWPHVASEYDGIVIAPYQWSLRLDHRTNWYYGWDCASGCIWRSRAVAQVRPVNTAEERCA